MDKLKKILMGIGLFIYTILYFLFVLLAPLVVLVILAIGISSVTGWDVEPIAGVIIFLTFFTPGASKVLENLADKPWMR